MLETFIQTVEHLRGQLWALPVFVLVFGISCHGLPTSLFLVAGGILFGFWGGALANVLGFAVGSSMTFWISRRWGLGLWKRWRSDPLPPAFQRPGFWLLLVVRLTGFPPLLITNLMAGLSEMRYPVFLAATMLGLLPWSMVTSFFAEVLWEALRSGGMGGFKRTFFEYAVPLSIATAAFGLLVGTAAWFGRKVLPKPQEGIVRE